MTAVPLIGTNLTLVGLTLGTVNNSTKKSLNDCDEKLTTVVVVVVFLVLMMTTTNNEEEGDNDDDEIR